MYLLFVDLRFFEGMRWDGVGEEEACVHAYALHDGMTDLNACWVCAMDAGNRSAALHSPYAG